MRRLTLVLLLASTGVARAEDQEASGGTHISYRHEHQVGFYAQLGVGYRLLVRYNMTDYCGQADKSVCAGATPPFVELGISYGISNRVEILTDLRLGIGGDFLPDLSTASAPRAFVISPGFKFYIDDEGSFKWFTTVQLAIDRTDWSADGPTASTDFGIRNVNGLLIDLHRTFGIYFHLGETVAFVRWLRFEMDGGIGLQARFP